MKYKREDLFLIIIYPILIIIILNFHYFNICLRRAQNIYVCEHIYIYYIPCLIDLNININYIYIIFL
jgi:hypothetical protein